MNEQNIIGMIVMHHGTYYKYRQQKDFEGFKHWMLQLQKLKGFATIEETIAYYEQDLGWIPQEQAS